MTDKTPSTVHVEFTTVNGVRQAFTAEAGPDRMMPGAAVAERTLKLSGKPPPGLDGAHLLVQRRVLSAPERGVWTAFDALDTEIRIGIHLLQGCDKIGLAYPVELPRLVGYEADGPEPSALHLPSHGEPSVKYIGRFLTNQEEPFKTGLLRALRLLEALGVVHGGISTQTVLWDGDSSTVQIVDFSTAMLVGENPGSTRRSPLLPPALEGSPPTTRDDVYCAGAVLCHVITGKTFANSGGAIRADLKDLLRGVFSDSAESRPAAWELLERVHAADPWPGGEIDLAPEGYLEGKRKFDEARAAKLPPVPEPAPPARVPSRAPKRASSALWTWTLVVIVAAIAAGSIWAVTR